MYHHSPFWIISIAAITIQTVNAPPASTVTPRAR